MSYKICKPCGCVVHIVVDSSWRTRWMRLRMCEHCENQYTWGVS